MLEACRSSPAPALLLWVDGSPRWEANPAARTWAPSADWTDARWRIFADHVRRTIEARAAGLVTSSVPLEPAVGWREAPIAENAWVAWLLPATLPSPLAPPSAEIFAPLGIGYWRTDVTRQRIYGNARAYALSGLPPPIRSEDGVSLEAFRDQVHPDDLTLMLRTTQDAMQPGAGARELQLRLRQPDGSYRHLQSSRIAEHDADGRVTGVVGVLFDVTAQVEAAGRERAAALSLRVLTERAGIGTWSINPERDQMSWHGEMRAVLGDSAPPQLPIAEAIERTVRHIHPDDREAVRAGLAQLGDPAFESGEWSWRVVRDDGALRWFVSRVRRQPESGTTAGVVIDVTEQREALDQLRLAEGRTALAAQIAGFGVWQYDLVTGERYWDAQMFRLRGVDPATNPDLDTVRLATTAPEDMAAMQSKMDRYVTPQADEALPDAERGGHELRIIRADDGQERWLASRAMVLREAGKNPQLLGLHWDITQLKQAEELRRQRFVAEEANRAKSLFLANMSHEIRTPMNAILGMAHLALRSGLEPRQHNYVLKIERSAKALLGLINDILDFSKIEAAKLDLERVEFQLGDVLDDLANLVGLQAEEKGLELVFALPTTIPTLLVGDPLRLGQVLVNLVNNAVKFTERGEVTLSIEMPEALSDGDDATLRFVVSDSGAGMTAQHLERLFQPFEQADASTSRQHGGTGLGLAISQRLVEAMGGRLEVESTLGQGSSFAFSVVFGRAPAGVEPLVPDAVLSGVHVLVVDDNATARQVALDLCGVFGLRAEGAFDAWDAFRAVTLAAEAGDPFELVLIDVDMPGMDGVSCAAQLLTLGHAGHALALTSSEFGRDRVLRRLADAGLGTCPVLGKPVLPSALHDTLVNALGRLPVRERRESLRQASNEQARRRLTGARVLLVDDNDINQELACELLREAGMVVTPADHGVQAIELLRAQEFDLVLMDCQMPVMDGYEATVAIRTDPRWVALPIIAMTANVMTADRDRALASGMNDVIAKPIDIDAMFATLARWLPSP